MGSIMESGKYYGNVLQHFNGEIKEKQPNLTKNKVLFYKNAAQIDTSKGVIDEIKKLSLNCFLTHYTCQI